MTKMIVKEYKKEKAEKIKKENQDLYDEEFREKNKIKDLYEHLE